MPVHKSAALQQLAGLATGDFDVPPFVSFAVDEWHSDRARVLADVGRVLGAARLMVRSDRASEGDTEAGAWLSEGAIAGADAQALAAAVERVIASYGAWRADDRVLLQCQVLGAEAAGVAAVTRPVSPSVTSSVGPPLSAQVTTALREAKASTVTKP